MCDGWLSGLSYSGKELEDLTIAGCWVHARRRFDEALKTIPASTQKKIRSLYHYETDTGHISRGR